MAHTGTTPPTGEEGTIDFNLFEEPSVESTENILMETCRSKVNNLPHPAARVGLHSAWRRHEIPIFHVSIS